MSGRGKDGMEKGEQEKRKENLERGNREGGKGKGKNICVYRFLGLSSIRYAFITV